MSNRFANKISFILEDDFGIYVSQPKSKMQLDSIYYAQTDKEESEKSEDSFMGPVMKNYSSTCCICRSGSAADTQYLADTIRHQLLRRKLIRSTSSSVSEAAHLIKNHVSSNESLSASLICAGFDHVKDQGLIYSIDLGGTMMEQQGWACNGSGSGYILGMIDDSYPKSDKDLWDEDEAVNFVKSAIGLAMERDGSSGGVVRIFVINREGKKGILHVPAFNKFKKNGYGNAEPNKLSNFASPMRRQN